MKKMDRNRPFADENMIEGRNPVLEAYRAGRTVEKLFVQKGASDGALLTILREAKKQGSVVSMVEKDRLNAMSDTGAHQGVIARVSEYSYVGLDDIFKNAESRGEQPFIILLDKVEDPHNLGAIIRTANLAGAHGLVLTKHRSAPLSAVTAKASAGAINYLPIARVTNLASAIDELKEKGLWFVCADSKGEVMYELDLSGAIGLVLGSEGEGVSRIVKEKCDMTAAIPMKGNIDSLNVSVAAGILSYEIVRQRIKKTNV